MNKKRVYIAGKLNDSAVGYIKNCNTMIAFAEEIRKMGFSVYVPCLDYLMGLCDGHYEYRDFFDNSLPWLDVSDYLFVCPGYEESDGTRREILRALNSGIEVVYTLQKMQEIAHETV